MAERAEALVASFNSANDDLIATVEGLSDEQWNKVCEEEGWSVGVTAHHVAAGYPLLTGLIQGIAAGADIPPISMNQIDDGNAKHADEFASVTKEDTVKGLREGGAGAATAIGGLTDEQLDKTKQVLEGAPEMSLEDVVAQVLDRKSVV